MMPIIQYQLKHNPLCKNVAYLQLYTRFFFFKKKKSFISTLLIQSGSVRSDCGAMGAM
jgi:hypothetical protein